MTWRTSLLSLRRDAEEHLESARSLRGDEHAQVIADLESEQYRLAAAWARHNNQPIPPRGGSREAPRDGAREERAPRATRADREASEVRSAAPATVQLQASWVPGRVVAWAAGGDERNVDSEKLIEMLAAAERAGHGLDAARIGFGAGRRARRRTLHSGRRSVGLAGRRRRRSGRRRHRSERAVVGPGRDLGHGAHRARFDGPAAPATQAQQRQRRDTNGSYSVRWTPALMDATRLTRLADSMPGVVCAFDPSIDRVRSSGPRSRAWSTQSAATAPAGSSCPRRPAVRTVADVSEAVISRLDGSAFDTPVRIAGEIATRVEQWARSVTGERERLVVRLDSPDAGNAWHLAVFASGPKGELTPIEHAIVNAGSGRARLEDETARLERMLPALAGPGAAPRASDPEPGRSVGVDDRHRPAARGRRFRRPRPGDVVAQAVAVVARVRRRDVGIGRGCEPARQRPVVGGVRRRRAHRSRHPAAREGSAPAHPLR